MIRRVACLPKSDNKKIYLGDLPDAGKGPQYGLTASVFSSDENLVSMNHGKSEPHLAADRPEDRP